MDERKIVLLAIAVNLWVVLCVAIGVGYVVLHFTQHMLTSVLVGALAGMACLSQLFSVSWTVTKE